MDWNRADYDAKTAQRDLPRRRLVVLEYIPRDGDVVVIDKSDMARAVPAAFRGRRLAAATR